VEFTAVVPTLGASPWLGGCLEALRRDAGRAVEIVVVHQGGGSCEPAPGLADRVISLPANLGFAGGTNRGLAAVRGRFVATVNDDLEVEAGWSRALLAALAADPGAAAVQGVNLLLDDPGRVDGCGIAWNRSWQAVQRRRGRPAPPREGPPEEVFGVSATAALFRPEALAAAALPGGGVFDPRLGSYYEDVDLAGRLRAAGWKALVVPAARARHAGSATGSRHGLRRLALVYGNRHLVLARLLGRGYWRRLPAVAGRDLADWVRAPLRGDLGPLLAIPWGWARALRHLPAYARAGPPLLPPAELERFREAA
jgi:GT2 family glycosyltransferase